MTAPYREILLAMGYKRFEYRSFVLLLLAYCSHVSPISRYEQSFPLPLSSKLPWNSIFLSLYIFVHLHSIPFSESYFSNMVPPPDPQIFLADANLLCDLRKISLATPWIRTCEPHKVHSPGSVFVRPSMGTDVFLSF